MKKLLLIFSIFTITTLPALADTTLVTLNCTESDMNLLLLTYCEDRGYRYKNTNDTAYGTYSTTKNPIEFGCYNYLNPNTTDLKKAVANTCGIPETQVTILNNLERDSNQIKILCSHRDVSHLGILKIESVNGVCVPTECVRPRWELSGTGKDTKCVEQKCKIDNGTGVWLTNGIRWKCTVKKCKNGYKHDKEKNKCLRDGEPDADKDDDTEATDTSQPNESRLSETDSLAKIEELRDNAEAMRAKEQSTANRLLGAAGIVTTGIGAMQTASAMAEQNADADAERTMRAYLATFHCNYGAGKSVQGGQSNIDLPGGNELIGLYSEYVNLANDLKVRKNALNIRPGIESEPILDAATSGLYDDVAIGTTSGAYTSLARALMDPNGADAAAWAQQKSDTADRKKAGMITAGIGVAGSLAANLAINHFENKKSKILTELQTEIADIPPQTAPCPNGTTGDQHPNCTCNDKIYNPNSKSCEPCPGNQIVNNNNCQCPANLPLWDTEQNKCIARQCTPQCTPTEGDHLIVLQDCRCTCDDGYDYKNGKCVCESPKQFLAPSGECVDIVTQQVTVPKITNNHTYTNYFVFIR